MYRLEESKDAQFTVDLFDLLVFIQYSNCIVFSLAENTIRIVETAFSVYFGTRREWHRSTNCRHWLHWTNWKNEVFLRLSSVWFCFVRLGLARLGSARLGSVQLGACVYLKIIPKYTIYNHNYHICLCISIEFSFAHLGNDSTLMNNF